MSGHPEHGGDSLPVVAQPSVEARAEEYKQAGKSKNTEESYRQAINHFRNECHGHLPATAQEIVDYITTCAQHYKVSTIKVRLAGLSRWHKEAGFTDYTKSKEVKEVLRGIAKVHNKPQRQATPLPFDYLQRMVQHQEQLMSNARSAGDLTTYMRCSRDTALLLIGFWRGFRSDELSRIEVQNITVYKGSRMEIFLPYSKTDREAAGRTFTAFALKMLCPVQAYCRWIEDAGIATGPVFRSIDRWGHVAQTGIAGKSIGPVLNSLAEAAGLEIHLSTHSLRHGFAKWAADNGWDVHSAMEYVGWKNYENAKRYIPPQFKFGAIALDSSKSSLSGGSVPTIIDPVTVVAVGVNHGDN